MTRLINALALTGCTCFVLFSWKKSGGVCPDVPWWGGSSLLSFEGGNYSSPTAPLLMEASSQIRHQLYPVSSTTHTQILYTFIVFYAMMSTGFRAITISHETPKNIPCQCDVWTEQSLSKFPQLTLPKYTDPWACPDQTPALPRALARCLTNPRSQIPQQTSFPLRRLLFSCFWKNNHINVSGQFKHSSQASYIWHAYDENYKQT